MEMFIYKVIEDYTKLYHIGVVIAYDKDEAKRTIESQFSDVSVSITIISKESLCDTYASFNNDAICVDIDDLCYQHGYRTKRELELQKKINKIAPLIKDLSGAIN